VSSGSQPPLVLVHGLWDSPRLFDRLEVALAGRRDPLLVPHLPHGLGVLPLEQLAERLGRRIVDSFGPDAPLDLLGFSMGGVIARTWVQLQGGHRRVRRLISVGSPQQGTWIAQPWPGQLLASIADMKAGSPLLRRLNGDLSTLGSVQCLSYYCPTDQMVVPGWRAVLPIGERRRLPVLTHAQLIRDPRAVAALARELLRP
jgi:triacylglycerol lipase